MKKFMAIFVAFLVAVGAVICTERVHTGYVGVVYSAKGVEQQTISQGWHFMSPLKHVSEFPITQQRVVFSNSPSDYGAKEHADWHIDAPANGGTIASNLTVNYNFLPEHVVELYTKFGGMDGESLMESKIQNDIIAYVKEVTPQFSVMQIYSDDRAGVNTAITNYLNEKLTAEYGINVSSALIVDYDDGNQAFNTYMVKAQDQNDAMNKAHHRFEKAHPNMNCMIHNAEKAGG